MEQFLANGICKGAVYGLTSIGFYLIYTTTGVFHLAHAAVCAAATYIAYICLFELHISWYLSLIIAAIITGILGLTVDISVYKPLQKRNASATVLLISSLGANVVLTNCILLVFSSKPLTFHSGPEPTSTAFGVVLTQSQIRQVLVFILIAVSYMLVMKFTPWGRLCTALADNPLLASTLGVDVAKIRAYVFFLGSAIAGTGSILLAVDVGTEPSVGMPLMLSSVAACVIGGLRQFQGPILGALLLGLIQGIVAWGFASTWELAVTFSLLIGILLFRGQGVLSSATRPDES